MRDRYSITTAANAAKTLLNWYDVHARALPWRIPPQSNTVPDPYHIWLSEVMLQQTTVAAVKEYFLRFTARWPTVRALAAADDGDVMAEWAGLGYYARARNLLKCARAVVADHGGVFPAKSAALQSLPGIGPYTGAAIASIAFDRPEVVVDGNIERVMARLFDIHTPLPSAKPELTARAAALTPQTRSGDYAQAVMDLGATICTPKKPVCGLCPWRGLCLAHARGTMSELPQKTPKKPKPTRFGIVYIGQRGDGAWLMERRPNKGLLGGMLGWPGSDWKSDWDDGPQDTPPIDTNWQEITGEVRHTFTHFHLRLIVKTARITVQQTLNSTHFVTREEFHPSNLPTVMRKAFDLARPSFET